MSIKKIKKHVQYATKSERNGKTEFFHLSPSKFHAELYNTGNGKTVTAVTVYEVDDGEESPYWGWLRTGEDIPIMIWPAKILLDACFPYGLQIEEDKGKGRPVNLVVEEA